MINAITLPSLDRAQIPFTSLHSLFLPSLPFPCLFFPFTLFSSLFFPFTLFSSLFFLFTLTSYPPFPSLPCIYLIRFLYFSISLSSTTFFFFFFFFSSPLSIYLPIYPLSSFIFPLLSFV